MQNQSDKHRKDSNKPSSKATKSDQRHAKNKSSQPRSMSASGKQSKNGCSLTSSSLTEASSSFDYSSEPRSLPTSTSSSRLPTFVKNGPTFSYHSPSLGRQQKSDHCRHPNDRSSKYVIEVTNFPSNRSDILSRASVRSPPGINMSGSRPVSNPIRSSANSNNKQGAAKNTKYEEYMSLDDVQKALNKGEVVEVRVQSISFAYVSFVVPQGLLRINPHRYEDAYISSPVIIGTSSFANRYAIPLC